MTFPVLETDRLRLIEIEEKHADSIYKTFSLEEVTRYYGMVPFTSREQAVNMVKSFANNFQEQRSIRWGITIKETEEFVGTVGLNNLLLFNKRAEVGYELHPNYWHKGIASEAVKAVVDYSFRELDLYRLGANTFPENEPSYSLLLKLGFQKEGLLRGYIHQGGKNYDALIFGITKPDWAINNIE